MSPELLMFGEIIPITLYQQHATKIAPKFAKTLWIASRIISPVTYLVFWASRLFYGRLGQEAFKKQHLITREDLALILRVSGEESDLQKKEKKLIHRVFHLAESDVADVMVPLINFTAIPDTATGQDAIKCRFLYKDLFEYFPEYKLVLLTNHEPVIKSQDYSIWRRVLKIPFNVKRPKEEWNLNLRTELIDEREGIFAWLVEGAVAWHKDGLKVTETVIQATEDYKDDLDVIGDFLDMCTDDGENLQVRNIDLFRCYEQWCEGTNNKPFTNRTF